MNTNISTHKKNWNLEFGAYNLEFKFLVLKHTF